jgi:hypothetical protein
VLEDRLSSEGVTLSIDDVSFPSPFDSSLATESTSVPRIAPITFSLDTNTSGNSRDTTRQKAQTPVDDSGAKTDLDGFDRDLAQAASTLSSDLGDDLASLLKDRNSGNTSAVKVEAAPTLPSDLGSDLTSLLKDLNSGNASAAKAEFSELQAQAAPTLPGDLGSDLTSLLKDLNSGNASAAKAEFSELQAQAAPTLPGDLGSDLASLLKDMTTGNTSAAKADVSKVQADLQTQDASSVADAQTGGPLDALIGKISDSLDSGSVQGASQDGAQRDLANFLVENGQGAGSLVNTSA